MRGTIHSVRYSVPDVLYASFLILKIALQVENSPTLKAWGIWDIRGKTHRVRNRHKIQSYNFMFHYTLQMLL